MAKDQLKTTPMSLKLIPIPINKTKLVFIRKWLQTNGMKFLLCSLLTFLLIKKDVTLSVSFNKDQTTTSKLQHRNLSSKPVPSALPVINKKASPEQIDYIQRFAKVAKSEMGKYGIPASIKLAQGLLESKAGESRLATKNNNHFGIKCFSKNCKKGHCTNFSDDSHKDFFRVFDTAWASYRAHSELLQSKRYKHLLHQDYTTWVQGLSDAGYATDPQYSKKLLTLIETLELYKYDS